MPKKLSQESDPLLPTVNDPGTFAWCEEVVECINAAWAAREQGEQRFLATIRAALAHRIWETLSPPPPQEPYTSLANLIRRTAPPGQAESMQLVIKFSGLEEGEATPGSRARAVAVDGGGASETSAPWADLVPEAGEDAEAALGRRILEEFETQMARGEISLPDGPAGDGEPAAGASAGGGGAAPEATRMTPAQRKREKLAQTHPDLLDAVQAGAMSLKQAYVEAGIEKPPQTLDRLQKLWRNATDEERKRFVAWVQEQIQKARKAEYEADVYGEG
ncbi:MAG: hypothetical protein ACM30E_01400 [Nitrososphaerales archaeon]